MQPLNWVDIGINLTNRRYDKDRQQVVQDAFAVGVNQLIVTGTNVSESQRAFELTREFTSGVLATAGCHPHDAKSLDHEGLAIIEALLQQNKVVAVGECGLDFNRNFSPPEQQIKAFRQQLELAVATGKPVFLHERDAFDTQYEILKDYMPQLKNAVAHCFTGTREHMEKYLELGLFIGITGWICDERRGQDLYQSVRYIPDDRLMLETDGPYLTPRDLPKKPRDGRNEPRYLPHIAETVAKARGQTLAHVSQMSFTNSDQFFQLNNIGKSAQ